MATIDPQHILSISIKLEWINNIIRTSVNYADIFFAMCAKEDLDVSTRDPITTIRLIKIIAYRTYLDNAKLPRKNMLYVFDKLLDDNYSPTKISDEEHYDDISIVAVESDDDDEGGGGTKTKI